MNLGSVVLNAAIVAGVSLLFNVLFYFAFERRERLRDQAIAQLTQRLQDMQDREIAVLHDADEKNDCAHKEIYRRMETEILTLREFQRIREEQQVQAQRIERAAAGQQAQITELSGNVAKLTGLVELIASQLKIRVGGS